MKALHINECTYPLTPPDLRALGRFMPGAEFVRKLNGGNDHYWVDSDAQIERLRADLAAVDPELLSPVPYERGENIMPWLDADLLDMLQQAAAIATAR